MIMYALYTSVVADNNLTTMTEISNSKPQRFISKTAKVY